MVSSFCHTQKLKIIQTVLGGCSLHFHNAEGIRLFVSQKGNSADAMVAAGSNEGGTMTGFIAIFVFVVALLRQKRLKAADFWLATRQRKLKMLITKIIRRKL